MRMEGESRKGGYGHLECYLEIPKPSRVPKEGPFFVLQAVGIH